MADKEFFSEQEPLGLLSDACSFYSRHQLDRLISSTWESQRAPLDSFVSGKWPSLWKALLGRHAGLPLDPATGRPYRWLGMAAPLSAFRVYGDDCYFYALHIHEGAAVAVLAALIASLPMIYNLLHPQTRRDVIFYSQSSLFAGCPLSWLHIICDCAYTVLIVAYCIFTDVDLDLTIAVLNVNKSCFTH